MSVRGRCDRKQDEDLKWSENERNTETRKDGPCKKRVKGSVQ